MSKWRRRQRAIQVAVIRDGLEQCGLYPFQRYDFRAIARQKRIDAASVSGRLNEIFKAVYNIDKIESLVWGGPGSYPAYQHRGIGR